jgi:7,8-dihydroneopterin aldolase/epimerase/oxygenase
VKPYEPMIPGGHGWCIVVDELAVCTRVGLHAHEYGAPQPVVIDARLRYRGTPGEEGLIDYDGWCSRIVAFMESKPHTRLLETLALEIAALSFDGWSSLDALTITLSKPKIREGTRRLGVEFDWRRGDYDAWRARSDAHAVALR